MPCVGSGLVSEPISSIWSGPGWGWGGISCFCCESNSNSLVVQHIAWSLQRRGTKRSWPEFKRYPGWEDGVSVDWISGSHVTLVHPYFFYSLVLLTPVNECTGKGYGLGGPKLGEGVPVRGTGLGVRNWVREHR